MCAPSFVVSWELFHLVFAGVFQGRRVGFVFGTGVKGTGYYRDTYSGNGDSSAKMIISQAPESIPGDDTGLAKVPKQRAPVSEIQARRNRGRSKADDIDPMDPVSFSVGFLTSVNVGITTIQQ